MAKSIIELAADLVAAQAAGRRMEAHNITDSLEMLHATLAELSGAESVAEQTAHFEQPSDSIGRDEVICLECGKGFKLLSNKHLGLHGLTPRSYKQKHGLLMTQPLSSLALTRRRKRLAKELGHGGALADWRAARAAAI